MTRRTGLNCGTNATAMASLQQLMRKHTMAHSKSSCGARSMIVIMMLTCLRTLPCFSSPRACACLPTDAGLTVPLTACLPSLVYLAFPRVPAPDTTSLPLPLCLSPRHHRITPVFPSLHSHWHNTPAHSLQAPQCPQSRRRRRRPRARSRRRTARCPHEPPRSDRLLQRKETAALASSSSRFGGLSSCPRSRM